MNSNQSQLSHDSFSLEGFPQTFSLNRWERLNMAPVPTLLCFLHRVVGILQKFGDNRLDVLSHVSSLGESGAVADRKRNIKTASQCLRQQCFPLEMNIYID